MIVEPLFFNPIGASVTSELIVCLFLSLALAVASLMVIHLRRQRRGLQDVLHRVLNKEFYDAEDDGDPKPDLDSDDGRKRLRSRRPHA
jgi:hypothetical protein